MPGSGAVQQFRPQSVARGPILDRIHRVVLLAGGVRPTPLQTGIGRSVLDLPLDRGYTLLNHWQEQVGELAQHTRQQPSVLVMVDWTGDSPRSAWEDHDAKVEVQRDPLELRGTGGVLRDLASYRDDDEYLLVAAARQLMLEPLAHLAAALACMEADVSLVAHDNGAPSGVMLIRCGVLRDISPVGFVDMKEQALPRIAQQHTVKVLHRARVTAATIRNREDYLAVLHLRHGGGRTLPQDRLIWDEDLAPRFSLVEDPADVAPGADLHDTVVLHGGKVGAGAVVARSVVCGGGVVAPGAVVVDQIVVPRGR